MSEACVLDDGRRVRFSPRKRQRSPYYLASFRGPDGVRKELFTKEPNKKRATDAAIVPVREAFALHASPPQNPSWDEAISTMRRQTEADNLRPKTIEQYLLIVGSLRKAFPKAQGLADITPAMASRDEDSKARKFKLHNFRGTAMSVAKMAGVSFEEAAIAFGFHPETMREHYLALDEVAIMDRVMVEIQGFGKAGGPEASAPADQANPSIPAS